ncbi:ABC transporter substrate-binding protein [Candidatus Atribacteria bacterium HGW-Atribacteria-1]|nr:MAG: ABC transporter substrate-binding protein [Candidatus Atribacteria bacterium HGW-Atribacteria-1]
MKRNVLLVLMVGLLIFATVTVYAEEKVLTVIHPWAGAEEALFKPVLEAAEEELGIKIKTLIYRSEELITLLPAQFAAETAVGDIIFLTVPPLLRKLGQEGHILEVTGAINEADFVPGSVDPVKVDGKLYAAPYTSKVKPGFWYRKSFFKEHGLTPPKTWKEFVELLEEIKQIPGIKAPIASGDGVGWPLSDVTEHFLIAFGGPQLHRELADGVMEWTDPCVKGIFEGRLVSLLKAGYFSEPIEWTMLLTMWWEGDYALYFMGSWITGMVEDPNDLGLFTLPGTMGAAYCIDYLFVPAYIEQPEEVKKLFAYLVTKGQEVQVTQGGHIATYLPVPLDAYSPVDRTVAEKARAVVALLDLDDKVGGEFQTTFWDQLKLLWVRPERLNDVLKVLEEKAP